MATELTKKVIRRARWYAYDTGLRKEIEPIDYDMVVNAFIAGYKSALRDKGKTKGPVI